MKTIKISIEVTVENRDEELAKKLISLIPLTDQIGRCLSGYMDADIRYNEPRSVETQRAPSMGIMTNPNICNVQADKNIYGMNLLQCMIGTGKPFKE